MALEHFDSNRAAIIEYLKSEYGYPEEKAVQAAAYLLQVETIALEFLYYVQNGDYIPDRQASTYSGYTVKRIVAETGLTIPGAFHYMIFLHQEPEEALSYLENGLPKRKNRSANHLQEVRTTMDEQKDLTPTGEVVEQAPESPVEAGVETTPEAGVEAPVPQEALLAKLDALQQALAVLQQTFDTKIAEDAHKNGLFDNMHRELIRYQNGALEKIVDTMALDIIQLGDNIKKSIRIYDQKEPTEENYKKLLRVLKGISEDLEDILYRQSIECYRVDGHAVNVRRQKIIQTVPTDDASKDNLVAVRVADGYEKGERILRPERIKIFKYESPLETSSET